jgi:endogenous inhibitor of DNA gyrase (YacG/DUF329 family)
MNKDLLVKCPGCSKEFKYYSSKVRPFCTDRCKLIDVGQWLDDSYKISGRDNTVYVEDSEQLQTLINETNEDY